MKSKNDSSLRNFISLVNDLFGCILGLVEGRLNVVVKRCSVLSVYSFKINLLAHR